MPGLALALALGLSGSRPAGAQTPPDMARRGRALIETWCLQCHALSTPASSVGGATSSGAPAFTAIARDPAWTPERTRAFLLRPHQPMPPLELSSLEIDEVLAYLASVRAAPKP